MKIYEVKTTMHHILWSLLIIASWQIKFGYSVDIQVINGGYENVVVALGSDLTESNCDGYVQNVQAMINSASTLLLSATGDKLQFSSVNILIPGDWSSCGAFTLDSNADGLSFGDAHIRIQTSHPYFGDNPWTQQPRGCGEHGEYIYISDGFLSTVDPNEGSEASVFVHEWAKFRWGVFEEYGHAGDSIFPSAYRDNSSTWTLNYCTNGIVNGAFEEPCTENTGDGNCNFIPDSSDPGNGTSSLLATPFIDSVNTFCTQDNHITSVPTKQNLLCNKASTWDVISGHNDFSNLVAATPKVNVSYSIQQMATGPSFDRIVFLLDTRTIMGSPAGRWEYLQSSVQQFIRIKASEGLQAAIVLFGNSVYEQSPLITLNSTNREDLAQIIPDTPTYDDALKNVSVGITAAAEILNGTGKIILITENLSPGQDEPVDLAQRASGLAVQPILYPSNSSGSPNIYDLVTKMSNLNLMLVRDEKSAHQFVECLVNLTKFVQEAGHSPFAKVSEGSIDEMPGSIDLQVQNSSIYDPEYFIEVLSFASKTMYFSVVDAAGEVLVSNSSSSSSQIYIGNTLQDGDYNISSGLNSNGMVYAAIYAKLRNSSSSTINVHVTSSSPLDNLQYTRNPPTAPILYAMLSDGIRPIVYAEVMATINLQTGTAVDTTTLQLFDNGVGGDVTGNDGTYSSYITGIEAEGIVSISVTANDNNGAAKVVSGSAVRLEAKAAPVTSSSPACCGSSLSFSSDELQDTGTFTASSPPGVNGQTTGTFPSAGDYPPGRITDLRASRVGDTSSISYVANISFTATGDDFDQGQASFYVIRNALNSSYTNLVNSTAISGDTVYTSVDVTCGTHYSFYVEAFDSKNLTSEPSNEVHLIYQCIDDGPKLSAGAISGIVIGCILFIILVALIIYAVCNRGNFKETKVGSAMTCQCCKKKPKEKSNHLVTSRTARDHDIIRSNPVRRDVYDSGHLGSSRPSAPVRGIADVLPSSNRQLQTDSESERRYRNDLMQQNIRMADSGDESSDASSHSGANPRYNPKNRVGIPLATSPSEFNRVLPPVIPPRQKNNSYPMQDNYGYQDTESGAYSVSGQVGYNKKAILPPLKSRINTQV